MINQQYVLVVRMLTIPMNHLVPFLGYVSKKNAKDSKNAAVSY